MNRFSDNDREQIRSQLVDEGRSLFAQYGLERTRIRDVTDAVDIGTSTFYQFFDSKEALYIEVLAVERRQLNDRIRTVVAEADTQPDEFRACLRTLFREVRSNPLITGLIIEDELRVLQTEIPDAERDLFADEQDEEPYIERWTDDPDFKYDDPDVVRGIVRSLVFTTRARDVTDSGERGVAYETIEDRLIETVVDGLFSSRSDDEPEADD